MIQQKITHPVPFPSIMQDFFIAFMQAIKAGRLYLSGHPVFKQSVRRLHDQLLEVREDQDFFFVGFAKDFLVVSDQFFQVNTALARDFLNLFHRLGISYLLIHKDATPQDLESFVETLSGAKTGQAQEVVTALHHANIKRIKIGLLDYSILPGVEFAVSHFMQGGEEAVIWQQLILRPAVAGVLYLDHDQMKEILRLFDDPESLKKRLAKLDRDLQSLTQGTSPTQRGQIIGNFLMNIGKAAARIDESKLGLFKKNVNLFLSSITPEMRVAILSSATPELIEGEDGDVIRDLIKEMPEQELLYLLIDALSQASIQAAAFNNLFRIVLARFRSVRSLLNLVRTEMNSITRERRADSLNLWQHLEQLLVHHQESEELNAQYRKAIEDLATSIKIQKGLVEEEEIARLVRTLTPDSIKLLKARVIIDLLHEPKKADSTSLPLLKSMGVAVRYFLDQGRSRLVGDMLRQMFLSVIRLPQKDFLAEEVNAWLSAEDVHNLLKGLLEKCRTHEPREMSAISSICQLYPEKAGTFLIERYLEFGHEEGALSNWVMVTLKSIAPHLTSMLGSRMAGTPDAALPRLIDLADLLEDLKIVPALEKLLDHKDYDIRSQTIRTLGRLKSERSVGPLARVVLGRSLFEGKKKRALKMNALQALAEIQTKDARAVLEQVALGGSGPLQKLSQELLEKS